MTPRKLQLLIPSLSVVLSAVFVSAFPTDEHVRRHRSAELHGRVLAPDDAPPVKAEGPGGPEAVVGATAMDGVEPGIETIELTDAPTLSPLTDAPTPTPGAIELFLCTQDPKPPTDKFCEETLFAGTYYTTNDACLAECWGMMACPSIFCVTESPTLSPTISAKPTDAPTVSRAPTTLEPTTHKPTTHKPTTLSPVTSSPTTAQPSASSFTFSVTTNGQDPIESIPLSPFRLDFVLVVDGSTNSNDGKRRNLFRGGDTSRKLQSLFKPAQDAELLSLVSDHLLDQFTKDMVAGGGKPMSVELGIDDKEEQNVRDGKLMVSYSYIGHAVYAITDNNNLLPTTAEVDSDVLNAFNSRQGKRAWLNAVQYSEDDVLQDIVNVIASYNPIMNVNQAVASDNEADLVDSTSTVAKTTTVFTPIVAVIVVAFATTLLIIGFLTYRKYQKYKRSMANNDSLNLSYQSRKRKGATETNVKNRKRYDHFQSPEGSVVSPSEEPLNLEIVGGDTYPVSQDHSDAGTTSAIAGRQFHPHDESSPYDEATPQNTTSVSSMVYYSQVANQMCDTNTVGEETLEGLYSDKDSYFQSTFAPSVNGQQLHGDGIHSLHSLDTLDNTFGFTSAQSMDALDNPEEKITHLIEGFEEIIDRNERVSSSPAVYLPAALQSTGNICDEENSRGQEDMPVTEHSPEETAERSPVNNFLPESDEVVDSSDHPNVVERRTSEEGNESIKTTSNTSEASDTDELFARITELENKMIQTETTLKTSTFDETDDSDELFSRITELENKMFRTESVLASASKDEMDAVVATNHGTEQIDVSVSVPPNTSTHINTLEGIFTEETLVKIEENRLKCTPPPSEGEVDNEIIKAAKENTLLGKFLDESTDDDSVFEN
ncbi:hypothetical protein ACHAWU_004441 [Discostella pseudostelligera]|uniref:VWFA domain-containing protein n=1 Tax=Discostella pseudostelligera TaxID=259834 RepID=A0ABD3M6K2_9STRA